MDFEKSALYLEVQKIINGGPKPVNFKWKAQLHYNGNTLDAYKVVSSDNIMDFEQNFTDEYSVKLLVPQGQFIKRVYPFRNDLEVTLIRTPTSEMADSQPEDAEVRSERYIGVLMNQGNPLIEGNDSTVPTEEVLDLSKLVTVDIQLISKAVNILRMKSVGGIFRGANTGDVIKTVLTNESQSLDIDKQLLPLGVDIVDPNNTAKRHHIVIPHGVRLVEFPQYVHDNCGGVYSSGLGYYYHNRIWHIYPLYNTERFINAKETITIINVSGDKLRSIERTYRKDGDNLVIIATGDSNFSDISDHQQLNLGNGARFSDANKFIDGFIEVKGNKAVAARGANVSEVKTVTRANGYNNVHLSDRRIVSNAYKEYSDLARRDGAIINVLWENANPDLIFPGMPVKVLYMDKDDIKTLNGVLLKAHIYTYTNGQTMFALKHHTNIALSVFINRKNIQN